MDQNIKEAVFRPILNSADPKPFRLKLNLQKIRTGLQLKQKVAKYLNHFPECMLLQDDASGRIIEDNTDLFSLNIKNNHSFSLATCKRNYQPAINVERLIVGGIDLTEIKQMAAFLTKKKHWQSQRRPQQSRAVAEEERPINRIPTQLQRQRQKQRNGITQKPPSINLRIKYQALLVKVKDQFGCIKDENQILAILDQFNGDIERASNQLFSQ